MYEPTRFFRSLLLCGVIYSFAYSIKVANALDTTYEVGGVTRTSEFIPNPAGANGSKAVYAPNSAAKMPNGTRIPYGLRGTLRTSSKLFKQLMLIEGGLEVMDWIKSQYQTREGLEFNPETLTYEQVQEYFNYFCENGTLCYTNNIAGNKTFASLSEAIADLIKNGDYYPTACNTLPNVGCTIEITVTTGGKAAKLEGYVYVKNQSTGVITKTKRKDLNAFCKSNSCTVYVGSKEIIKTGQFDAGEPTIAPNPWRTGEIIEAYAGKIGGWGDFVSPNVQILDQTVRWTELPSPSGMPTVDTVTDLIRVPGYEPKPPALIPDPEPLRPDPDGLKKIPNPLLQGLPDPTTPNPPPAVRTKDLIGGGMTVTNTYNIQNTSTAVNLNIENKEITYTGNEEEIKPPADLTETETLEARQRLLVPTTDENFMNSYVQNILSKVPVPQVNLLSDSSAKCPPPRRLALFGTTEIELSYEGICQFLPMVKVLMLGFIGFSLFGFWLKRISSS